MVAVYQRDLTEAKIVDEKLNQLHVEIVPTEE